MKVIVITTPHAIDNEADLILAALQAGADRVHIRKPDWSAEQTAELVGSIPFFLRELLTLHDHFELCEELGVGGLQLNSRNGSAPQLFTGVRSSSCHTLEELRASSEFDYVTLSPIYDSISKGNYPSNFTNEELLEAAKEGLINSKTIAMGGVTPDVIPMLHALGFGGVALLGYVWQEATCQGVASRVSKAVKMANMCKNFSLQYITHRNEHTSDIEGAEATLKGGCRWVQLRMKGYTNEEVLQQAKILREMCDRSGATFLLNDRAELVAECEADGVHLGKEDMRPSAARELLGEGAIIGGTANTCDDIDYLVGEGVDYIGLGPFRFTTTKERLSPTLGLEGYKRAMLHCKSKGYTTPIVAIGGITTEDISLIMECGVSGIALSGTILNAEDSVAVTSDIIKRIKVF